MPGTQKAHNEWPLALMGLSIPLLTSRFSGAIENPEAKRIRSAQGEPGVRGPMPRTVAGRCRLSRGTGVQSPACPGRRQHPQLGSPLGRVGTADYHQGAAVAPAQRGAGAPSHRRTFLSTPPPRLHLWGRGPPSPLPSAAAEPSLISSSRPSARPSFLFSELDYPLQVRGPLSEGWSPITASLRFHPSPLPPGLLQEARGTSHGAEPGLSSLPARLLTGQLWGRF